MSHTHLQGSQPAGGANLLESVKEMDTKHQLHRKHGIKFHSVVTTFSSLITNYGTICLSFFLAELKAPISAFYLEAMAAVIVATRLF